MKKVGLFPKFMTSKTSKQIIAIRISFKVSRSKGNETMKFDQFIEYNMKSSFLEKPYTNSGGETTPRPSPKTSKLRISLDQQSEDLYGVFVLYVQVGDYRNKVES